MPQVEAMQANRTYIRLQDQWRDPVADPSAGPGGPPSNVNLERGLRKIDAFGSLVHVKCSTTLHIWIALAFVQLHRDLHLARIAYENKDEKMMIKIQEAINLRWVNAYRQTQDDGRAFAD